MAKNQLLPEQKNTKIYYSQSKSLLALRQEKGVPKRFRLMSYLL